jgi:hypothetical protein
MSDKNSASVTSSEPRNKGRTDSSAPLFVQEITDHVAEDGTVLRSIVSRHSDGFVCLQLINEADKPEFPGLISFGGQKAKTMDES